MLFSDSVYFIRSYSNQLQRHDIYILILMGFEIIAHIISSAYKLNTLAHKLICIWLFNYKLVLPKYDINSTRLVVVVFWVVTLYSHALSIFREMEAARLSEKLVSYQITTLHHNPEHHDLNPHCGENL
jgi:hypothetical protein